MDDTMKKLKLIYQNTRGLRTKTNEFYNNLLLIDTDIIMITETWLYDGIMDAELCNDNFIVFRRDRGSLGGGVMIMCALRLQARLRSEWLSSDLECIWITIPAQALGSRHDLHIALIYIPPNCHVATQTQLFVDLVSQIRNNCPNDHFIIAGDFNLPCIDWNSVEPVILKRGLLKFKTLLQIYLLNFHFLVLCSTIIFQISVITY